jgi:hypothetical protein
VQAHRRILNRAAALTTVRRLAMSDIDGAKQISFSDAPDEEESKIDEIPRGERNLRTQAYDMSISDLVAKITEGDIVLDPDYQRKYVWDEKRASLLIESILLNVPIPVVYVAEDEDGKWDVVDGLQRLNSLKRFFGNEFKLKGLEVLNELNRVYYKDLNPRAARILRNGILRIILIFKESHPDIKYEIFMRLNRGAVRLTEQELRNCLYRGRFNDMLHALRETPLVLRLLGIQEPDNRMADAELLLRHFLIRAGYDRSSGKITTYSGNMKSSLNHYMAKVRNLSAEQTEQMKQKFLEDAEKVNLVFAEHSFQRITPNGDFDGRINRAVMDAVLIGVGQHTSASLATGKNKVIQLLKHLINQDATFADAITIRTSDKQKMEYRVHTFTTQLAEVLKG